MANQASTIRTMWDAMPPSNTTMVTHYTAFGERVKELAQQAGPGTCVMTTPSCAAIMESLHDFREDRAWKGKPRQFPVFIGTLSDIPVWVDKAIPGGQVWFSDAPWGNDTRAVLTVVDGGSGYFSTPSLLESIAEVATEE